MGANMLRKGDGMFPRADNGDGYAVGQEVVEVLEFHNAARFNMYLCEPLRGFHVDDIEAIKQLKARYFRTMDTKDWDGMRRVFCDDVQIDTSGSGGSVITGADGFLNFLRGAIGDAVTVHHGHTPEIDLTSATTATGIWAMEDMLRWPDGRELHGFGHYHETYSKVNDHWRIQSSRLTRLRMDMSGPALAGQ
jgi:SnoaL-like domain